MPDTLALMSAEPEDAIPAGFEPAARSESAEVARAAKKKGDYAFLAGVGVPWFAGGVWLESASHYSGWVSLLMAGGVIFGFGGLLGEDLAALPIFTGMLLGLAAYVYGVVTSHDSVGMLIWLALWMAGAFLVFGGGLLAAEPPRSQVADPAAEVPVLRPEPQGRDVRDTD